jgi:hypothetical protein
VLPYLEAHSFFIPADIETVYDGLYWQRSNLNLYPGDCFERLPFYTPNEASASSTFSKTETERKTKKGALRVFMESASSF